MIKILCVCVVVQLSRHDQLEAKILFWVFAVSREIFSTAARFTTREMKWGRRKKSGGILACVWTQGELRGREGIGVKATCESCGSRFKKRRPKKCLEATHACLSAKTYGGVAFVMQSLMSNKLIMMMMSQRLIIITVNPLRHLLLLLLLDFFFLLLNTYSHDHLSHEKVRGLRASLDSLLHQGPWMMMMIQVESPLHHEDDEQVNQWVKMKFQYKLIQYINIMMNWEDEQEEASIFNGGLNPTLHFFSKQVFFFSRC